MGAQFFIDIEPSRVRAAVTGLHQVAAMLTSAGDRAAGTADDVGPHWSGRAAVIVTGDMRTIGAVLRAAHPALLIAADALNTLAATYDDALQRMGVLNNQWQAGIDDRDADVARAHAAYRDVPGSATSAASPTAVEHADRIRAQAVTARNRALADATDALNRSHQRLITGFGDLRDDVTRATRQAAEVLADATVIDVPDTNNAPKPGMQFPGSTDAELRLFVRESLGNGTPAPYDVATGERAFGTLALLRGYDKTTAGATVLDPGTEPSRPTTSPTPPPQRSIDPLDPSGEGSAGIVGSASDVVEGAVASAERAKNKARGELRQALVRAERIRSELVRAERAVASTDFVKSKKFQRVSRGLGIASPILVAASAVATYLDYKHNSGMTTTEAVISSATVTLLSGLGAVVGAQGGAAVGGAAGSAVPIIGNGVGALVGGAVGGAVGGYAGGEFGEGVVSFFRPEIEAAAAALDGSVAGASQAVERSLD